MTYTDEQITQIADGIFDRYPKDVMAYKMGLVTRDDARRKIMFAGVSHADAERILNVIDETDYQEATDEGQR